jgi:hypothetical protein
LVGVNSRNEKFKISGAVVNSADYFVMILKIFEKEGLLSGCK